MDNIKTITSVLNSWSDGPKYVFIDPALCTADISNLLISSRGSLCKEYYIIPSYGRLMEWIKYFHNNYACIVVICNLDYADDMQKLRPDLEIRKIEIN